MEEWQTLERALGVLVCTFQRYCRKEGDRHRLSKRELQELLESELPSLRTLQIKEGAFEELTALLDTNKDGEVDFEEYIRFVAAACTFFHDFFQDSPAVQPRVQESQGGAHALQAWHTVLSSVRKRAGMEQEVHETREGHELGQEGEENDLLG